ncbi:MAG TPA: 3-hydroxy-5-phosphonooxypentane-2,4-dione thiolase [Mesotoga infera]|nr:3-hydroxy-5-phosphonooxypentane-2,4-dione thiolase [Mesotoga infera]
MSELFGKANRLSRIFNRSGKTIMLALDHGMALGPMQGLERPAEMLDKLTSFTDSIMLNKGILRNCYTPNGHVGIVLRVSGAATIAGEDLTNESITTTVIEALRLSADAVATSIYVGTSNEHSTIRDLAQLCDECETYGLPVLAVTAIGKDRERKTDPRYLSLAVRVAVEMGADIVKTYYCDEKFEKVVEAAAGIPIVIAGGPKMDSVLDVLKIAENATRAGARGVDMGRNVWQHERPVEMLLALKDIVNDGVSAEEAYSKHFGR